MGESGHGQAEEGLGGVDDVAVAERRDRLPAAGPEVVLVVDEQRRAELAGQVEGVAAADEQLAAASDRGVVGQQAPREDGHDHRWYRRDGPLRSPASRVESRVDSRERPTEPAASHEAPRGPGRRSVRHRDHPARHRDQGADRGVGTELRPGERLDRPVAVVPGLCGHLLHRRGLLDQPPPHASSYSGGSITPSSSSTSSA